MIDISDEFLNNSIKFLKDNQKKFPKSRLMRVETFNLIQETLEKYTGKAALLLLQRFGELNAEMILIDKKFQNLKLKELIEKSVEFGSTHRWFVVDDLTFGSSQIDIKINSTFESAVHSLVNYNVCSFLEGFFKKVSNSSKEKVICLCEEVKCIGKGDDCCEFKIKKIG